MLRVLFCLTVVWIIIPHEPDIGMGRPGFPRERVEAGVVRLLKHTLAAADQVRSYDPSSAAHVAADESERPCASGARQWRDDRIVPGA